MVGKLCYGHSRGNCRFKPPRETLPSGETLIQNHLPLGGYGTFEEAKNVHQIAAFYYGKAEPHLDLGDGRRFAIDSSWNEHLDFRRGKEKAKWVARKAKEVFQDFKKAKALSGLLNASNNHPSVIPSGEQIANARDSSHSGFSSPLIYKSPENLASSSRATLPVASNPDKQWFAEVVLDEGYGAVNEELSGDVEYFPISSPSPVTQDFIEPTCSSLGLPVNSEFLDAFLLNFTDEELVAKNDPRLDSRIRSLANELGASLLEPDGPCSPVVEVATVKENEGSYVEAAIPDEVSLGITTVPVEVALPDSQGLQSPQDGMDVGALLPDPSFCSELSIEDHLLKVSSLYQQKCEYYKRRISELEREVKRLKGKSPM